MKTLAALGAVHYVARSGGQVAATSETPLSGRGGPGAAQRGPGIALAP